MFVTMVSCCLMFPLSCYVNMKFYVSLPLAFWVLGTLRLDFLHVNTGGGEQEIYVSFYFQFDILVYSISFSLLPRSFYPSVLAS